MSVLTISADVCEVSTQLCSCYNVWRKVELIKDIISPFSPDSMFIIDSTAVIQSVVKHWVSIEAFILWGKVLVPLCDSHVISSRCRLITPEQLIVTHMSYSKLHQIPGAANKAAIWSTLPDVKLQVKWMAVITCNDDPGSRAVIRARGN